MGGILKQSRRRKNMVEVKKIDGNKGTQPDTFVISMTSDEFWDLAMLCMDAQATSITGSDLTKAILGQGRKLHSEVENMLSDDPTKEY